MASDHGHKGGGHARHEEHEEHEEHVNHEAWVIPYADMLTLLMALFLVLFAIGRTDTEKAKLAADSFKAQLNGSQVVDFGGGGGVAPFVGSGGVLDNAAVPTTAALSGTAPVDIAPDATDFTNGIPPTTSPGDRALAAEEAAYAEAKASADSLSVIEHYLQASADANGIGDQLGFSLQARGLVLTIVTDQVLFQPGEADLQPAGLGILDLVVNALASIPNDISIEGHTDNRPISNARFPSNWELSTARATSVLRYLIDTHRLPADRLSAAGYADTRPIGDDATVDGAAKNRRVEIVILSDVSLQPVLTPTGRASD